MGLYIDTDKRFGLGKNGAAEGAENTATAILSPDECLEINQRINPASLNCQNYLKLQAPSLNYTLDWIFKVFQYPKIFTKSELWIDKTQAAVIRDNFDSQASLAFAYTTIAIKELRSFPQAVRKANHPATFLLVEALNCARLSRANLQPLIDYITKICQENSLSQARLDNLDYIGNLDQPLLKNRDSLIFSQSILNLIRDRVSYFWTNKLNQVFPELKLEEYNIALAQEAVFRLGQQELFKNSSRFKGYSHNEIVQLVLKKEFDQGICMALVAIAMAKNLTKFPKQDLKINQASSNEYLRKLIIFAHMSLLRVHQPQRSVIFTELKNELALLATANKIDLGSEEVRQEVMASKLHTLLN